MTKIIQKEYKGISIDIEIEESFGGHEAKYYVDGKQVFRTSVPEDDYDEAVDFLTDARRCRRAIRDLIGE